MRKSIFKQNANPLDECRILPDMLAGITDGLGSATSDTVKSLIQHPGSLAHPNLSKSKKTTISALVQAERAVVGAVLSDNKLYDVVIEIIGTNDFSDPIASAVFKTIAAIIDGDVNGTSVAEAMTVVAQPGIGRLISLQGLEQWVHEAEIDPAIVKGRAHLVHTASAERELGAAVVKAQFILSEDSSIESKSDEILKLLSGASEIRTLPLKSLGNAAIEALTQLADKAKNGDSGIEITTGFRDLDALTAGLHGGQLIIIAARPGIGKTALVMSMGLAAAEAKHKILMASMEMKAVELSKRALSIVSGVDSHAIRLGALTEADWEKLVDAGEYLKRLPFDIVDLPGVNMSALSGLCRRLHRSGLLDVLIVDYLQIMETSGSKNSTREQQIGELSRGLKKLAMELDIPVIALSQLNRGVENRISKRPQLNDLRESGSIEQDADVVIFIHREDAAEKNTGTLSMAEIIVEKQRSGPPGDVPAIFDRKTTGFSNYPAAQNNSAFTH